MCRPCWLFVLGSVGILAWSSAPVWAVPKLTKFPDVMSQSTTIAVARLASDPPGKGKGKVCELELLDVLKGDIQPGRLNVTFEDTPYVSPDDPEFVVFLDKDFVWRFVAVPVPKGGKVADNVLEIHGFYNFNAHYVTPGLLTRKLLDTYIKNGTLVYLFRGPLYFPVKGEVGWKASAIEIEGGYDPLQANGNVKGLPPMKGFPAVPGFEITGGMAPCVGLDYTSVGRHMQLKGSVAGLDRKSETLLLKWFVTTPDFLTQKDFETFLADPAKVETQYRVTLRFRPTNEQEKPKVLTLSLGESGRAGRLEGWSDKPLVAKGTGWTDRWNEYTFPLLTGEELVVHLDFRPRPAGAEVMTWMHQNGLLYQLHGGDLDGAVLFRQNKEDRLQGTCKASLESVFYEKSN
jgi:hypothetical protein